MKGHPRNLHTTENQRHVLYRTEDPDAPDEIKDRNGEVVLGLCRICGRAEIELEEECMTNFVQDIIDFHKKFEIGYKGPPRELDRKLFQFRANFMDEELNEYEEAVHAHDLEKQLDALVDLLYVTFGTAHLHGFNIQEAWNRVHQANMQKVKGKTHRVDESGTDIAKPPGWKAADLSDLV